MTDGAARYSSLIHSPIIHMTQSYLFILKPRRQKTHLPTGSIHCRPTTPEQISATPPLTPEKNATGAKKRPGEVIPLRRHRLRHANAARTPNPLTVVVCEGRETGDASSSSPAVDVAVKGAGPAP